MVKVMTSLERGRPRALPPKRTFFGEWLQKARARKGWSGEQLAAEVDTSQSMISAYETGSRSPRRDKAALIANALQADPRDALKALMADTPGLEGSPAPDQEDLAELMASLSPEDREVIRGMVRRLSRGGPS